MTIEQYFAAKGSRFNNSDAAIIGPVLKANEGKTPADVWEYAKGCGEEDAFRSYFQWDHDAAWEEYNIDRAREMQRGIRIRRVTVEAGTVEARAFSMIPVTEINPTDERTDRRGQPIRVIVETASAMQEPRLAAHLLAEIHSALTALCNKYRAHKDLIGARWDALEAAVEAFNATEVEKAG